MKSGKLTDPLIFAVYRKDYKALEALLDKENINFVADSGSALLHLAVTAEEADPKMVQFLIDHGATVDAPAGRERSTPLHHAAALLRKDLMEVLLAAGADATKEDASGYTPLARVVLASDPKIPLCSFLIKHGADPDQKPSSGIVKSPRGLAQETGQLGLFADDPKKGKKTSAAGRRKKSD